MNSKSCLLTTLLIQDRQQFQLLNVTGRDAIASLCSSGFQLLTCWPRDSTQAVADWIDDRFFWLNPRAVSEVHHHQLCSVVSSQLGKDKRQLACWPTMLEWAIELAARDGYALLVAQGTTFDTEARKFADAAKVPIVEIVSTQPGIRSSVAQTSEDAIQSHELLNVAWLKARLMSVLPDCLPPGGPCLPPGGRLQEAARVELSPSWQEPNTATIRSTAERDRATIALADRVCCVWIRSGGKISQLVEERLQDDRFPAATCFIALPYLIHAREQDWKNQNAWLNRGAVGYVVQVDDWKSYATNWLRCSKPFRPTLIEDQLFCRPAHVSSVQQVCFPLQRWLENRHQETWDYFTHCTRGNSAAWPQESTDAYVRRVWNEGASLLADPLVMLMHILQEGRLRGSNRLTRGGSPVVSLSEMPVAELLQRRDFKKHLTRWDWEPYGFLFHRRSLPQARPVQYGDKVLFQTLSAADKSYFQPINGKQDWSSEQEWRIQGDVDLRTIPACSAMVFTKTRTEAQQLAWLSPFPIVWTDDQA